MQRWKWMQSSPSPQVEALGASRQERLLRLIAQPFAHRGLHGDGRVENSVAAFEAAIAAGHGFELDVQETADGQALVFHDYDLHRLTGGRGAVREKVMTDLAAIHLAGTEQRSEEHTSELQSLMRISYAVFCLNKQKKKITHLERYSYY